MDAPRRFFRTLQRIMRADYVAAWQRSVESGQFVLSHDWFNFRQDLQQTFRWADALSASQIRWKAAHQRIRLSDDAVDTMDRLDKTAAQAFEQGQLPGALWRAKERGLFDEVKNDTPWLKGHAREVNPFILERAAQVANAEEKFLKGKEKALVSSSPAVPIWRVEMIRRMGIGDISANSQQVALADPVIGDAFPFGEYLSREDRRTRPTHKAMHGFVAVRTNPIWAIIRYPAGWNCRCGERMVGKKEAISNGWTTPSGEPKFQIRWPNSLAERNYNSGLFPDKGFKGPKFVAGVNSASAVA